MNAVLVLLVFLSPLNYAALAEEVDFSHTNFKATPLAETIYLLEGAGGNVTASIGANGVFLVDDDFAEMAEKLQIKLQELHGGNPRYIVNTHFHYDHTGGNEFFGGSATILAATAVRNRLMTEQTLWKEQYPAAPKQAWPVITYEHSLTLHYNGEDIKILHLPRGHTDGDTVVFFPKSKVVSMGDLYFSGMYPIFHLEHNGSLAGYLKNAEEVWHQIPFDGKIVPGHGPVSTRAELRRFLDMIHASIAAVKRGMQAGKSLREIQRAGLEAKWEPFSHGYLTTDRWLDLVYQAVREKNIP